MFFVRALKWRVHVKRPISTATVFHIRAKMEQMRYCFMDYVEKHGHFSARRATFNVVLTSHLLLVHRVLLDTLTVHGAREHYVTVRTIGMGV